MELYGIGCFPLPPLVCSGERDMVFSQAKVRQAYGILFTASHRDGGHIAQFRIR